MKHRLFKYRHTNGESIKVFYSLPVDAPGISELGYATSSSNATKFTAEEKAGLTSAKGWYWECIPGSK